MEKNKIAVIGVGTAGVQSLCHFLSSLNENWEVTSIHNPSKKILGIGESTNPSFITAIENGLNFNIVNDLSKVNGTLKFGTKYTNWREEEFLNPLLDGTVAIHLDTFSLYEFAMDRLVGIWGDKFKIIKGNVDSMDNNIDDVKIQIDGKTHSFDFVVDCSGTPKSFDGYEKVDTLLNTCLVHNTKEITDKEIESTGHIATEDGWMFRVPLATRTSYGYLYNNTITSDNDATNNFSKTIGVPVDELQDIKYEFNPYYDKNALQGRVIKNGNAVAFFEPMFANSLFMYDLVNHTFYEYIMGRDSEQGVNERISTRAKNVVSMIGFHYLGDYKYSTKFWERAKDWGKDRVKETDILELHANVLDLIDKKSNWKDSETIVFGANGFHTIFKNLGLDKSLIR